MRTKKTLLSKVRSGPFRGNPFLRGNPFRGNPFLRGNLVLRSDLVRGPSGFTLVELLIGISISVLIMGAIYFSLTSALESWEYTRDELALQQVLLDLQEKILEGAGTSPSLRAALEVSEAGEDRVGIVLPWDERHLVTTRGTAFQLDRHVRLGAGLPIAEFRLPGATEYGALPISWLDPDNVTERPRIKSAFEVVEGSTLRLSYHPDPERVPESVVLIRWDPEAKAIFRDELAKEEAISRNPFGVVITGLRLRYFDHLNRLVVESGDVPASKLPLITAIEMELSGQLKSHQLTLLGMVSLRNSVRQSGLVILKEGVELPVPDSKTIRTLYLTNLVGIGHEDEIEFEIRPKAGRAWRVSIRFERYGKVRPIVAQVSVEYPTGYAVYTERPMTSSDLGFDFLAFSPSGLYDYDDDPEIEDAVVVTGETAVLKVTKMDVKGAALFVQP